ncbi:MAG: protein phosphatase 2C domain-containing protein [Betaproteobacteria bacterium]
MFDTRDSAEVLGNYHRRRKIACKVRARSIIQGDYAVMVCADGARHAKHSAEGAATIVDFLLQHFLLIAPKVLTAGSTHQGIDLIVEVLIDARAHLSARWPDTDFDALQSSVVACLLGPQGLCFIHLGNGFACAIEQSDRNFRFVCSDPHTDIALGTFGSITDVSWFSQLRIQMINGRFIFAACMSDGALALFQDDRGFAIRKLVELGLMPADEDGRLAAFLDNALARVLSEEDKSICYVCHSGVSQYLDQLISTNREVVSYPSAKALQHAASARESRPSHRRLALALLKHFQYDRSRAFWLKYRLLLIGTSVLIVIGLISMIFLHFKTEEADDVRAIKKLIEQSKKQTQSP